MEEDHSALSAEVIPEAQGDEISMQSVMTDHYGIERRRLKSKKFRVYKCLCSKKHHGYRQMLEHKRNCKQRRILKRRNRQLIENDRQVEEYLENNQPQMYARFVQTDLLEDLRKRVVQLQQKSQSSFVFDGFGRAAAIYEKYGLAIKGIIVNKVAAALENAHRSNISILPIENTIVAAIMVKLQSLSFDDCIQILSQKLSKAHKVLVEQSMSKQEKTKKHNERAYNFLSQFNQFELNTQVRVFDELLLLEPTHRRNVCRYWGKIRALDPYFSRFPRLPKLFKTVPRGVMQSRYSISEAAKQVRSIYVQQDKQLACDMWMVITLGLRFHDLLKLQFHFENLKLVKFFRLIERKNNNVCTRFVPLSLVQMIVDSRAQYPMTPQRLRKAVKQCLLRFKSSYGFKHRAITAILGALHAANPFARIHASAQMTTKHYLNHNDEKFLNEAFKVGIKFNFEQQIRKAIQERRIELDLTGQSPRLLEVREQQLGEISVDCTNIIEDRFESYALDGHFQDNFEGQDDFLSQQQTKELKEASVVSRNHQIELLPHRYHSLEEAIGHFDSEHQIVEAVQVMVEEEGDFGSESVILSKVAELTNRSIYYYDFSEDHQDNEALINEHPQQEDQNEVELVVSQNSKGYSISSTTVQPRKRRLAAIIAQSKLNVSGLCQRLSPPNCRACQESNIYSKIESIQSGIGCQYCGWKSVKTGALYPLKASVVLNSTSQEVQTGFSCLRKQRTKNNIRQTIQDHFPGKFSTKSMYSQDFPKQFKSFLKTVSLKFEQELKKCRQNVDFLPLRIGTSQIGPNAGLGVFATEPIPRDRLILTYEGVFGTSFSIIDKQDNDSLFELGWVIKKGGRNWVEAFEIIVDGKEIVGAGRFINSSKSFRSANLNACTAIAEGEPVIYFTSSVDIKAGEELAYFYGKKYWNQHKKKQSSAEEDNDSE